MDPIDMAAKAYTVASMINKIIKKGHKLYIHCTAGIGRAPQSVIAYLCFFQNYDLDKAVVLLRKQRPNCRPNIGI